MASKKLAEAVREGATSVLRAGTAVLGAGAGAIEAGAYRAFSAGWAALTAKAAEIDAQADELLKQRKRLTRHEHIRRWDWHAWQTGMALLPPGLLALILRDVDKRMREEERVREEIEESTGVNSRGFLVPQRRVREEVQGMLRSGAQKDMVGKEREAGRAALAVMEGGSKGGPGPGRGSPVDLDNNASREAASDLVDEIRRLRQQLDAMEEKIKGEGQSASEQTNLDTHSGGRVPARNHRSDDANARADGTFNTIAAEAKEAASGVYAWAIEEGQKQASLLVLKARDWLARERHKPVEGSGVGSTGDESSDSARSAHDRARTTEKSAHSLESGAANIRPPEGARAPAPAAAKADEPQTAASSSAPLEVDRVGTDEEGWQNAQSQGSTRSERSTSLRGENAEPEPAWRRGYLDESDKSI